MLVLSLFPGIDLLGQAFEESGFCVVRGPEKFLGQDIKNFHPMPGKFDGIIGGPPCQEFSLLNRRRQIDKGVTLLNEFKRCVLEAKPRWWLMENVATVPDLEIDGYSWQRFDINQGWYDNYSRLRHFQFGAIGKGHYLNVTRRSMKGRKGGAALATDSRSVTELLQIQGLTPQQGSNLKLFTVAGRKRVIGNGVPLVMGREIAQLIGRQFLHCDGPREISGTTDDNCDHPGTRIIDKCDSAREKISWLKRCLCGCGRPVTGRHKYKSPACRKRAQRKRDRAAH